MYRANQKTGVLPIGRRTYERGEAIDTGGLSADDIGKLVRRGLIVEDEEEPSSEPELPAAPPRVSKPASKKSAPKAKAKKDPAKKKTRKGSRKK